MNKTFRIKLCGLLYLQIVMAVMLLGMSRSAAAEGYLTLPTVADFTISCGFGCYTGHGGTDYSTGTTGKDVVAAYDGTVIVASDTDAPNDPSIAWPNTFGNYIKIDHGIIDGQRVITLYGHLLHSSFMVKDGMNVLRGQQLAKSGNSGTSTAPHLHFEVKAGGVSKDPYSSTDFLLWTHDPPVHSIFIPAQGLIQLTGDSTVYWLQHGIIYPVSGPSVIDTMQAAGIANWDWGKIVTVSDISNYTTGPSILTATIASDNLLVRDVSTKRIYKMNNGVKEYQSTLSSFADVIDMAPAYFAQETSGTYTVGQSAPTDAIRQVFVTTYDANSANLGSPTDVVKATSSATGVTGYYQTFVNGSIQYTASGANAGSAFAVYGEIYDRWAQLHYASSPLGLPTGSQSAQFTSSQGTTGYYQPFEGGSIQVNVNDNIIKYAYAVYGKIYEKWGQMSYAAGDLGLPIGDIIENARSGFGTTGYYQRFENGSIQVIGASVYAVSGAIYGEWGKHGYAGKFTPGDEIDIAQATWAGFPVSDVFAWSGMNRQDFEGGYIVTSGGTTADFVSDKHPQGLTAAVQTDDTILLTWQNRVATAGVNVYRSGSPTELIATVVGSATSYTDTAAVTGHAYTYFVTAYNETAESPVSNLASMSIAGTGQNVLTVSKAGLGSGTVTSADGLIDCGYDCSEAYGDNATVTLTAQPNSASTFGGWSGACTSASVTCTYSLSSSTIITASFNKLAYEQRPPGEEGIIGMVTDLSSGVAISGVAVSTTNASTSTSPGDIHEAFDGQAIASQWTRGGNAYPFISSDQRLQFGDVYNNQYSSISRVLNILESATVSFDYQVSSESGYDYLRFYIDGIEKRTWSGSTNGTYSTNITAGNHTFLWKYTKDEGVSVGSDTAWIDNISIGGVGYRGTYALGALSPGTYIVTYSKAGYQTVTTSATILAGQATVLDVVMPISLSGTVKDPATNLPLSGVEVSTTGANATTDANGKYTLGSLVPGDYSLAFSKAGYQTITENTTVVAGQSTTLDASLAPLRPEPVSPAASASGNATPAFDWQDSGGSNHYALYIDGRLFKDNIATSTYAIGLNEVLNVGAHTWYLKAIAANGSALQSSQTYTYTVTAGSDTTPPAAFSLSAPVNGGKATATPAFSWGNSSDTGSGISHYELYIDGALAQDNIGSTSYTLSSNQALANGWHTWYAKAVDKSGNPAQSSQTWSVIIDADPPASFSLLTPENDLWTTSINPTFTWNPSADNGSGLSKYMIYIDNVLKIDNISPLKSEIGTTIIHTSDFSAYVRDDGGRWDVINNQLIHNSTNSSSYTYIFTSPLISLPADMDTYYLDYTLGTRFYPSYGSYCSVKIRTKDGTWTNLKNHYTESSSLISARDFISLDPSYVGKQVQIQIEFHKARYTYDYIEIYSVKIGSGYDPVNLADGNHTWKVRAVDNVGNVTTSNETWTLRVDTAAPTAFSLVSPAHNSYTKNTTPTLAWAASADSGMGLSHYDLYVDGAVAMGNIPPDTITATLPADKALTEGNHTWYVKAYDLLGNLRQSTATFTLRIDLSQPPVPTLTEPANDGFVIFPTPNFSWNPVTDTGAGLSHYELWIDNVLNVNNLTTTNSSPAVPLTEGLHTWYIWTEDNVGNRIKTTEERTIYVDMSPPGAFNLLNPANNETVIVCQPSLTWEAAPDAGGIEHYELYINGVKNGENIPADNTTAQPVTCLPNGTYNWYVKAFDRPGGSASTAIWNFIVDKDTTPPSSTIADPVANATIGGVSYTVTGTATDNAGGAGVAAVEISFDSGNTWLPCNVTGNGTTKAWSYAWSGYGAGSYTITTRATDLAGNVEVPGTGSVVLVDRTLPAVTGITISPPSPARAGTLTITITFSSGARGLVYTAPPTVIYTPAGGQPVVVGQTSFSGNTWQGTTTIPPGAGNGTATLTISGVRDGINNVMLEDTGRTLVIDTTPPGAFSLISPAHNAWVNSKNPLFQWGASTDATSGVAYYALLIDGSEDRTAATTSVNSNDLFDGTYTWSVRAYDVAGNITNANETWTLKVDAIHPQVAITSPVTNSTVGGTAYTIRGTARDNEGALNSDVQLVEIKVDDQDWQAVVNTGTDFSSWSYAWENLANGTHHLQARATDRAGNVTLGPVAGVTVDLTPPTVSRADATPNPTKSGIITVQIDFHANSLGMDNSVAPEVSFITSTGEEVAVQPASYTGLVWSGTATIPQEMANGTCTIRVKGAKDNYGNIMADNLHAGTFVIDTIKPVVKATSVSPNPSPTGAAIVQVELTEATSKLDTRVNPVVTFKPQGGAPVVVTQVGYDQTSGIWSGTATIGAAMPDGTATLQVSGATDVAGNVMDVNSEAGSFIIDQAPPAPFTLTGLPDGSLSESRLPALSWNATADATTGIRKYQLYINDSLNADNIAPTQTTISPAGSLPDNVYRWFIRAIDATGNYRDSDTKTFTVDGTAPTSVITSPLSAAKLSGAAAVVSGTATDSTGSGIQKVEVSMDGGGTWHDAAGTTSWSFTWTLPAADAHFSIKSRATDLASHVEVPGVGIDVAVDNAAPVGTVTINAGAEYTKERSVNLTITASDTNGIDQMALSNTGSLGEWETFVVSKSCTLSEGDGAKTVSVWFKDGLGNVSAVPVTDTIILDSTPPTVAIGAPSAAVAKSGAVTYAVTYTEADAVTLEDANVTLVKTGTANGTIVVSGTGNTGRTVTISDITGDGTLGIAITGGTASDIAGNQALAVGPSAAFTVDNTPPVVNAGGNQAKNGAFTQAATGTDAGTMTYSWSQQAGPGTVTFGTATGLSTTVTASIDGTYTIRFTATDAAGNSAFSDMTLVWDTTPPVAVIGAPSATVTKSGPVTYTIIYTGADAVTLEGANVTLVKTGTANGAIAVSGTGNSARTVTISSITGDGTLGISIAAGTASDTAENQAFAAGPSAKFTVDNTAPELTVNPVTTPTGLNQQKITGTVTNAAAVTITTDTAASDGEATISANTWGFTISGLVEGENGVTVMARDAAGNVATATTLIRYVNAKGDVNGDWVVDLQDAIAAFKVFSGMSAGALRADFAASGADVNGDGRVGLAEVLYIIQRIAGMR